MFSLISSIAFTNIIYLMMGKLLSNQNNNNLKSYSEIAIIGFIFFSLLALVLNFFSALNPVLNSIIITLIAAIFFFKKNFLKKKNYFFYFF